MNRRVLIIVNPHAGKGMIKRYLCDVIDLFVKHQWQVSVVTTQAKGEATQLASDAALHYDLLVCSGGDGRHSLPVMRPCIMICLSAAVVTADTACQ